ncbi:MAG: hypothetical protein JWN51_14 [Phycisphaerales bacterium]|nr:hypothetical protein [Phycisphaerales bacterium]
MPHPPLRETAKPAKGEQWAEWNAVERFRGFYECRRTSEMSRGDVVSTEYGWEVRAATGRFEMVRENGHFAAVNVQTVGSYHAANGSDRWSYHGKSSKDGSFDGPVGEFRFDMSTRQGTWQFDAMGMLAKPYKVATKLASRDWDGGKWVEDNRSNSYESTDFPHSTMRDALPPGKPGPIHGEWNYVHGTLMTSKSDYRARVFLVPEYKDLELEVELEGTVPGKGAVSYEKWIPRGTLTGAAGSRLKVKARLQAVDGGPVKPKVAMFVFKLSDVSREPGVCMNFPRLGAPAAGKTYAPDLKFGPSGGADVERQQLEMLPAMDDPAHPHVEARVDCFDYGAWGNLSVTAELEDGRVITGHLKGDKSMILMALPRRGGGGGSHIADAWKKEKEITAGDEDDAERSPSVGKVDGDGFTLYEEYRGFAENGKYLEGDPKKIDFFVRNYIGADAAPGINSFEDLTSAAVHYHLNDREFDKEKRVMNANHAQGAHAVDQHGVYLVTAPAFDGAQTIFSKAGVRGRPVITMRIEMQPREALTPTMTNENARVSDALFAYDRAVTHELVHSVGGEHHGAGDIHWGFSFLFTDDPRNKTGKPQYCLSGTTRAVEITDEKTGRPLAEVWEPDLMLAREKAREYFTPIVKDRAKGYDATTSNYTRKEAEDGLLNDFFGHHYWYIGAEHGESSGDEGCVMRYSFASLYEKKGKSFAWYYISQTHSEKLGMELCRSAKGTGINDPGRKPQPRYGDAMRGWGPCADRIVFNDAAALEQAP